MQPHESIVSFFSRFQELNGTSHKQLNYYLGFELTDHLLATVSDIKRISLLLNENCSILRTVFIPTEIFPLYNRIKLAGSVRYCQKCVESGYHSYLHEEAWVNKCPIHSSELTIYSSRKREGSSFKQRSAALTELMRLNCKKWPNIPTQIYDAEQLMRIDELIHWARRVDRVANKISRSIFWNSSLDYFQSNTPINKDIGKLRTLLGTPRLVNEIIGGEDNWQLEVRNFPLEVKNALNHLSTQIDFEELLFCFKLIHRHSTNAPAYWSKYKTAISAVKAMHGKKCHCQWGAEVASRFIKWHSVDPSGWPYYRLSCPYNYSLKLFEYCWGRTDSDRSYRILDGEQYAFVYHSRVLYEAGLIRYRRTAKINSENQLYLCQDIWRCCQWIEASPLTELLNATVEFEINSAVSEISLLLKSIKEGQKPTHFSPEVNVHLRETDNGLQLFKWTRL